MWTEALTGYLEELMHDVFFKGFLSTLGGVLAAMFGGVGVLAMLLFLLLCCDFLLGFLRAWKNYNINANKMKVGVLKMLLYAVAVFVVAAVEHALYACGWSVPMRDFLLAFFCVHEALSCLDHLASFGVPVPNGLRERLRTYREKLMGDNHAQ